MNEPRKNPFADELQAAVRERLKLEDEIYETIRIETQRVRDNYEPRLTAAKEKLAEVEAKYHAEQAVIDLETAEAQTDPRVGKIYVKWEMERFSHRQVNTGKRGVVEVVGPKQAPGRWRGSQPPAGGLCIRELLKNGSPGKWCEGFCEGWMLDKDMGATRTGKLSPPWGWYPQGEVPKDGRR